MVIASFATLFSTLVSGCGGASSTTTTTPPTSSTSNVQAISVTTGPAAAVGAPEVDIAYTSVTICVPGSTTQCQTIGGMLVDTGSSGVRVLSSALTLSLPQQKDSNGNPIAECAEFVDGESWGPVQTADISMAGEKASSAPIEVIGSPSFSNVPTGCSSLGPVEDDLASFGANGIVGVGNYVQDCGDGCAISVSSGQNFGLYYTCPATGCEVTAQATAQQVANPVASFATDNNGVVIELPQASGSEASLNGSMIFGIGTQSNNGLGSATVYTIDPNTGNITTTFNGQTYTDGAFLDSGSNAIYFLDAVTTGMTTCADLTFWYCPTSTQNFSATNVGANGATGSFNFSIGNADLLTNDENNGVAAGLGGPNPGAFDWGLPFFFGKSVYTAIEGRSTPGGQGPYWAY
jgi:hypothetical protein